ncbi:MAG TPA: glycosyltransferase family 39 protein [Gemmatimonadaceae bacterium]|nr:glycosyltransferase family 39 protein [Gemmatimonadaceae bacterium]
MADGTASAAALERTISTRTATLLVATLAIASSARGLFNDFVYDDIPLIRDNVRVHDLAHVREIFGHAYWPPPFVEQLYRPLTLLLLAVQYAVGGGSPLAFRVVSYLLYGATAALVYRLATRVLEPRPALAVAALFAVHPVHVEAVALGVNQAELIVGLVAVVTTTLYIDRRRTGAMAGRDWLLLAALYGAATLVKESAFILPLLFVAAELTILRGGDTPAHRRIDIAGFGLLAAVALASLALRFVVAGAPAFTVIPAADLRGVGITGRMLLMLHVVPMWLRLLVWPHHLQVDFAPGVIASGGALEAAFGVVILCALAGGIVFAMRRAPVLAFGLLWLVTALLPVSNVVPTGVVLAERTLFLASIGFLLAVGAAAERAMANRRLAGKPIRMVLGWGCALLVMLGLLRSIGRQAVWNTQHLTVVPHAPIAQRTGADSDSTATRLGRGI